MKSTYSDLTGLWDLKFIISKIYFWWLIRWKGWKNNQLNKAKTEIIVSASQTFWLLLYNVLYYIITNALLVKMKKRRGDIVEKNHQLKFSLQSRVMKDWYLSNHNIPAPFITTNLPRKLNLRQEWNFLWLYTWTLDLF